MKNKEAIVIERKQDSIIEGVYIGTNTNSTEPIKLDTFEGKSDKVYHSIIIGKSGKGMSCKM